MMMKKTKQGILVFVLCISSIFASADLRNFVNGVTQASVRDYYYRAEDPSWDNLKFHKDKNREENTTGHDSVKVYLTETLESYLGAGNVYIDEFPWSRGADSKGYNVIGVKEGSLGSVSDIWIVGAHYDSYDSDNTGTAPGANDNGTGMVAVLEMARMINTRDSEATILFCFWDAEEPSWVSASSFGSGSYSGPSGSRAWINDHFTTNPAEAIGEVLLWSRVKGNINMDMFGYPSVSNTLWLYHGGDEWNTTIDETSTYYPTPISSNTLYVAAEYYLENYGSDDSDPKNYLTVTGKGTMLYSDNISFSKAGIPSLEYAESDWGSDIHYHKWTDYYRPAGGDVFVDDENPQTGFVSMVIRGSLALLADTANVDLSPESGTPVELSDFQIKSQEDHVLISWTTETEVENLGFILERREHADQSWEMIANYLDNMELMGQGSTSMTSEYSFCDTLVKTNYRYEYRLSEVDFAGKISPLKSTSVLYIDMARNDEALLKGNAYPNPFNPQLRINYSLQREAIVTIRAYDICGHEVASLVMNKNNAIGEHYLEWNANDLPSGIYLVQIVAMYDNAQREAQVMKLLLEK
jgi:hypothetical protein